MPFVDPGVLQGVESELRVARMEALGGVASSDPLRAAVLQAFSPEAERRAQGVAALEAFCRPSSLLTPEHGWWLGAAYIECEQFIQARTLLLALVASDPAWERAAALLEVLRDRVEGRAREVLGRVRIFALGVAFAGLVWLALRPRARAPPMLDSASGRLRELMASLKGSAASSAHEMLNSLKGSSSGLSSAASATAAGAAAAAGSMGLAQLAGGAAGATQGSSGGSGGSGAAARAPGFAPGAAGGVGGLWEEGRRLAGSVRRSLGL
jgi:hypothetical protein